MCSGVLEFCHGVSCAFRKFHAVRKNNAAEIVEGLDERILFLQVESNTRPV